MFRVLGIYDFAHICKSFKNFSFLLLLQTFKIPPITKLNKTVFQPFHVAKHFSMLAVKSLFCFNLAFYGFLIPMYFNVHISCPVCIFTYSPKLSIPIRAICEPRINIFDVFSVQVFMIIFPCDNFYFV